MSTMNKKLKLKSLDVLGDNGSIAVLSTVWHIIKPILKVLKPKYLEKGTIADGHAKYNETILLT